MQLLLSLLSLAQLQLVPAAERVKSAKAVRTPKPINWNLSYYSEPFHICKTLRNLNPVEQARAHGVAVDVFRKCGPNLIIPFATRYNFPGFAIIKTCELECFLCTVFMGFTDNFTKFDKKNGDVIGEGLASLSSFCRMMERINLTYVSVHEGERFYFTSIMCREFIYATFECALRKANVRDGDFAKYTIGYFKKILL